ncbi:hypothetical protein HB762_26170 (plasmid) [Vibrio campbellii]|uniref:Uncharacterized protein n=1 Tax=Vibrio campbellii TaxID=680 RepID=A0ABY5IKY3_9VIBR|nr:hypothetical protein [Vibrio campbellii]UTZ34749.1 hypothetical protein HB762_26170 [Vibrio campbellii]
MTKAKSPYSNLRIAMTVDPELQELLVRGGALIKSGGEEINLLSLLALKTP